MTPRPEPICRNCYVTWQAAKPKPAILYCWHSATIAQPVPEGWKITPNVGRQTLEKLRREGSL